MLDQFLFEKTLTHYTKQGEAFVPSFTTQIDDSNPEKWDGVVIRLEAGVDSLLQWNEAINRARHHADQGRLILWDLDFGPLDLKSCFDPLKGSSFQIAINEFNQSVWPHFQTSSFGMILAKGTANPADLDQVSEYEPGEDTLFSKRSRYFNIIAHELHRLGAMLPEELMAVALFDVSGVDSSLEQATLFSKERFAHIELGLQGAKIPLFGFLWERGEVRGASIDAERPRLFDPTLAVCLPEEGRINVSIQRELDAVFSKLKSRGYDFLVIPESQLTESWFGLDALIVLPEALDPQVGVRQCLGFAISGGRIIYVGQPLGLEEEVSFDHWF
ncbi:MAG: hypothetical protein K9M07_06625 [Simkaniaceae bacterium]|nr:hypothetical protein [Simkaniaceae bacterium]